jgi:hypothetical protein
MQHCRANQQILEGDAYAAGSLLTLYPPGQSGNFERNWVYCDGTAKFFGKSSSAKALRRSR